MVILDMTKGLNHIGRLGENEHRTFRFPDSCEVLAMYPEATVSVLVKRPGDSVAYPVAPGFVEIRNGAVYWTVQSADLARIGRGNVELTFVDGTTVAKNIIYDVYVDKALDGAGDPPEPWESWQTDITAIAGEIAGNRTAAEQAAEDAIEAQGKAEAAQEAAESAERGAGESAGAADTSARAAAESAGAADRSAGAADQSAQAAGRSAIDADQSAQTAAGSVTAAGEQAGAAAGAARDAAAYALEAERMTFGTEGGVPVPATSPYNENNVKHYMELTAQKAQEFEDSLSTVEAVKNAIVREIKSKNLIDPDAITIGRLASDGNIQTNMTGYYTSDYIFLEAGKTYVLAREKINAPGTAMIIGYGGYGFYDTSKVWIANSRVYDNYSDISNPPKFIITPSEDCYIRVTCNKNYYETDIDGKIILKEGSDLDGYEAYFTPYFEVIALTEDNLVQEAGNNTDKIMSQKAVTDCVERGANAQLDEVMPYVVGKNLYDVSSKNPQNFVFYDSTGAVKAANGYAIIGKTAVEPETQYIFSATTHATQYLSVVYFSGDNGETFISNEKINGPVAFTTPADCTFVDFNLFGRTHTDDDLSNALAVAQLEKGSMVTPYEPYERKRMVSTDSIEGGDQIAAIGEVTEKISIINLYDKSLAKDGKYYMRGVENSNADCAITGKIPVKPNRQYCISRDPSTVLPFSSVVYMFDASGTYLRNATLGNYVYSSLLAFSTDADVYFVAVNMRATGHTAEDFQATIDSIMLCYGTARPLQYSPYSPISVTIAEKNTDEYFNPDVFAGKRWLATGTSITWYDSKAYQAGLHEGELCRGYVGNVARRKALLVTNEGISGSTLANVSSSSLINRYQDLDWANADIATIEYGVNDFGHAVDIGTADDAPGTDTFAACLKTIIEYALTQNPKLCLVICTEPDVRGSNMNNGGHYLKEYTDVTLEIAKQYRLPVCDWYYHSGINAVTKGSSSVDLLTADGTHPNDAGHLRMGAMLNQVFDSLIC